jgi:SpoIIAA-like
MLDRIADLPGNVVGIVAKGELTSEDYEKVLIPAVDQALQSNEKIRLLYVLGGEFNGLTAGAVWDDTRVLPHHEVGEDRGRHRQRLGTSLDRNLRIPHARRSEGFYGRTGIGSAHVGCRLSSVAQ